MSRSTLTRLPSLVAALGAIALMSACGDAPTDTSTDLLMRVTASQSVVPCDIREGVEAGKFKVIKYGSAGDFDVVVQRETDGVVLESFNLTLGHAQCAVVHQNFTTVREEVTVVTVTETSPNFLFVDIFLLNEQGVTHQTGVTDPAVTSLVSSVKGAMTKFNNAVLR